MDVYEIDRNMSSIELANLGDGEVAYIKTLTSAQAHELFPSIDDLPDGINLFAVHGADGTPIALTDSMQAALGHVLGDELVVANLH